MYNDRVCKSVRPGSLIERSGSFTFFIGPPVKGRLLWRLFLLTCFICRAVPRSTRDFTTGKIVNCSRAVHKTIDSSVRLIRARFRSAPKKRERKKKSKTTRARIIQFSTIGDRILCRSIPIRDRNDIKGLKGSQSDVQPTEKAENSTA